MRALIRASCCGLARRTRLLRCGTRRRSLSAVHENDAADAERALTHHVRQCAVCHEDLAIVKRALEP